jgi:hypothetical protein
LEPKVTVPETAFDPLDRPTVAVQVEAAPVAVEAGLQVTEVVEPVFAFTVKVPVLLPDMKLVPPSKLAVSVCVPVAVGVKLTEQAAEAPEPASEHVLLKKLPAALLEKVIVPEGVSVPVARVTVAVQDEVLPLRAGFGLQLTTILAVSLTIRAFVNVNAVPAFELQFFFEYGVNTTE